MPVAPRTAPREPDQIREVFLSSTAKDVAAFRQHVEAVLRHVDTAVFLQEDWASPAMGVVALCLGRLRESDAYVGIFGFRYGWIPKEETRSRSITQIECEDAIAYWKHETVPPIFLFLPKPGEDAAEKLEAEAVAVLAKEFPDDEPRQVENRRLQKAFTNDLRSAGTFIREFSSRDELGSLAQASVSNWNRDILKRALRDRQAAEVDIPSADLGEIGRKPQREAIQSALLAAREASSPGLCVVVHGAEDCGHFQFISFLESWEDWETSSRPHRITPSHDQFDTPSVVAAAFAELGDARSPGTATPAELGRALVDRCRDEPIVLLMPHVDRLSGGLDAFHQHLWTPVMDAARARRQQIPGPVPPFCVVLAVAKPQRPPLAPTIWNGAFDAADVDWHRLVPLPELTRVTATDVKEWLEARGLKLIARVEIAKRVTLDGAPRAVFDRLNGEKLWSRIRR